VPIRQIKINPAKQQPISPALEALLSKSVELKVLSVCSGMPLNSSLSPCAPLAPQLLSLTLRAPCPSIPLSHPARPLRLERAASSGPLRTPLPPTSLHAQHGG